MEKAILQSEVWNLPSVVAKVQAVNKFIECQLRKKNIFAWREFIEDLKVDIQLEIYKYEEKFLKGECKEVGVGAYCRMATQEALNYAAFYGAKKRRGNFETISYDQEIETPNGSFQLQIPAPTKDIDTLILLNSIETSFGPEIKALAQRVLDGEHLSKKELAKLRTDEFKNLLLM